MTTPGQPQRCGFCLTRQHHNCVGDRLAKGSKEKPWVCACECWRAK